MAEDRIEQLLRVESGLSRSFIGYVVAQAANLIWILFIATPSPGGPPSRLRLAPPVGMPVYPPRRALVASRACLRVQPAPRSLVRRRAAFG